MIVQLRQAVVENEGWYDQMHFDLEEALQRAASLESDKQAMSAQSEVQRDQLLNTEAELRDIISHSDEMVKEKAQAQATLLQLQTSLGESQAQLDATIEEYTSLLASHESDLANARKSAFEKESHLLIKTEEHRLQTSKIDKLEGELKTTNLILASKEGEIARLQDKIGTMRFEANEKMFEADTRVRSLKRELGEKEIECSEMDEELRSMREERDRADRERGEVCLPPL